MIIQGIDNLTTDIG